MRYVFPGICSAWSIPSRAWSHTQHIHTHDYIYFATHTSCVRTSSEKKGWNPPFQQESPNIQKPLYSLHKCWIQFFGANMNLSQICAANHVPANHHLSKHLHRIPTQKKVGWAPRPPKSPNQWYTLPETHHREFTPARKRCWSPKWCFSKHLISGESMQLLCRFCLPKN